ncbi:uncharacterized protein LOC123531340 isoform X2 [Mercenaria mercenaria]|uniref:uncharacterized protein LOC123531340 isoform X2 n=1 Tax=Mercenaria mercenaria TaxID=6596 RepID=UPI00234FB374|nr:uncharacterized protein LOC123531340 isoform X2 [Mercenaria mercenaria]
MNNSYVDKMLLQNVCLLLISPCFIATNKHQYGSDSPFDDMNATSEYDTKNSTVAINDGSNFKEDNALSDTTTQPSEKDEADRKKCNKNSYEEEKCLRFLQKKLMKDTSSIKEKIAEWLKDLPLCWHTNGSIVHIDPRVQICCNGVANRTTYEECCSGTLFDNRKYVCCNNTLHVKTDTAACCGPQLYDTNISLCCNGSLPLIQRLQNMECCGNKTLNNKTHVCCRGNTQQAFGLGNKKGYCCNDTSYHEDCHACKKSTVLYALFDESVELCCHGKIIPRLHGNNSECCHRRLMNNNTDICVEKKITPKPKPDIILDNSSSTSQDFLTSNGSNITVTGQRNTELSPQAKKENSHMSAIGGVIACVVFVSVGVGTYCSCRYKAILAFCKSKREASDLDNKTILIQPDSALDFAPDTAESDMSESQNLIEGNDCLNNKSVNECYTNETNLDNESVCSDGLSFISGEMAVPKLLNIIEKKNLTVDTNLLTTYFAESYTQTGPVHITNRRTIFGHPFEHTIFIDESSSNLAIPSSDVILSLPRSVLKSGKVEVNCSSFSSLADLRKKLGLSDNEVLASPVVEFAITGYSVLPEHARVVLPFVGSASDLTVKKFKSDEGLNTVATSVEIAEKLKQNEDLDSFYTVEGSSVIVYTKSFSGFYCTGCRHKRQIDLNLKSFIFGSYKRINRKCEVGISTYIADEIFKFTDYQKRMVENEESQERQPLKKDVPLLMPNCDLDDKDFVEACITLENEEDGWIHRLHPSKKRPLHEARKEIELERIAQKCKECPNFNPHELEIPYYTEWNLTTATRDTVPSEVFQCTIDLNICKRGYELKKENSIFIEELWLRSKDRLPVKEDYLRAAAPAYSVQETETCSTGLSQDPSRPRENTHMTSMGNRPVRRELSHLPVTSYSEADLTRLSAERPIPELSAPPETIHHHMALPPASPNINDIND